MSDTLAIEIAQLPTLNRAQLQAKWRSALRQSAPAHLRKQLLVPLLAYKLQEQAYGGLSPQNKRRLRELANNYKADPTQVATQTRPPLRIKPGTRLIRRWEGETHHVTVQEDGFEYRSKVYKSLSHIAREITGTRWSGPLFFGLKQAAKVRSKA